MHKLIFHTEANTVEKEIHIHTHTQNPWVTRVLTYNG